MKNYFRVSGFVVLALSVAVMLPVAAAQDAAQVGSAARGANATEPTAAPSAPAPALFATVNGKQITQAEFHGTYGNYLRQKFYHGEVPQQQLVEARQAVADQLIDRILFLEEIERRGVTADIADVDKQVESYDRRYANNANWQKSREAMLPGLRTMLMDQSRIKRLEQAVRTVPTPSDAEVSAFYSANPQLFTEPEKLRLHTILLAVDPSSSRPVWDAAMREAESIVRRIRAGADFSEQARLASKDDSAAKGGDMGYLHLGMLPESLQVKLKEYKYGEVGDPIELLQGVGIFRLDERLPERLMSYEQVTERARELLVRQKQNEAWDGLVAKLRKEANVVMHESQAQPVAAQK